MATSPIHVLWNGNAGSAAANADVLNALQQRADVTVWQPQSSAETARLARQAAEEGASVIAAAGGDGTVNTVAQALLQAGAKPRLGVLPLGTGNDFSRTLAIPLDVHLAVNLLTDGETRRVDAVRAEVADQSTYYVNMATGGNSGQFTDRLTDEMKRSWGPLVYLRGVIDVLAELVRFDVSVQFDNGPVEDIAVLNIFVANGRTSGTGLLVSPDASIEDELLDVVLVRDCEPLQLAGLAANFALGDYRRNENIVYRRARKITIASQPEMAFTADGDVLSNGRVVFTVCPAAMEVIVGPEYVATPPPIL